MNGARETAAHLTPGQRWRTRRDLVICLAHREGCSERFLADVFNLPHSRIHKIIAAYRSKYGGRPTTK